MVLSTNMVSKKESRINLARKLSLRIKACEEFKSTVTDMPRMCGYLDGKIEAYENAINMIALELQ